MYALLAVSLPVALVSVVLAVWFVPSRGAGHNLLGYTWLLTAFTFMALLQERAHRPRVVRGVFRILWFGMLLAHPLLWLNLIDVWAKHRTLAWVLSMSPVLSMVLPIFAAAAYAWLRPAREGRCIHCDYDLTGNESGRCPECGTLIKPVDRADTWLD